MSDPMRSLSIAVRLTPRQAVDAMRALELAAMTSDNRRALLARRRIEVALTEAGWVWHDWHEEWRLEQSAIKDPW